MSGENVSSGRRPAGLEAAESTERSVLEVPQRLQQVSRDGGDAEEHQPRLLERLVAERAAQHPGQPVSHVQGVGTDGVAVVRRPKIVAGSWVPLLAHQGVLLLDRQAIELVDVLHALLEDQPGRPSFVWGDRHGVPVRRQSIRVAEGLPVEEIAVAVDLLPQLQVPDEQPLDQPPGIDHLVFRLGGDLDQDVPLPGGQGRHPVRLFFQVMMVVIENAGRDGDQDLQGLVDQLRGLELSQELAGTQDGLSGVVRRAIEGHQGPETARPEMQSALNWDLGSSGG